MEFIYITRFIHAPIISVSFQHELHSSSSIFEYSILYYLSWKKLTFETSRLWIQSQCRKLFIGAEYVSLNALWKTRSSKFSNFSETFLSVSHHPNISFAALVICRQQDWWSCRQSLIPNTPFFCFWRASVNNVRWENS